MSRRHGELDSRTMRVVLFMAGTLVLLLIAVLLLGCGDDDNPTGPSDGELKDYVFYFTGYDGNDAGSEPTYYRYYSAQQKVDTVGSLGDRFGYGLRAVSADGERLYFSHEGSIHVVDSSTFETITVLGYSGDVVVSPDNQLIAVIGYDIWILSVPDYSVVFHDTADARTRGSAFSTNSQRFYCGSGTSGPSVYVVDLEAEEPQLEESPLPYPELQLQKIIPSVDETKWFLYRRIRHDVFAFEAYDVGMDSLVFSLVFGPGYGDMAMTPDGRYVFFTSPGELNSDIPGNPSIYVFDAAANALAQGIPPVNVFFPGQLAISPDGSRLVAAAAHSNGSGRFSVADVHAMEVIESYYLGREESNEVLFYDVYCQIGNEN